MPGSGANFFMSRTWHLDLSTWNVVHLNQQRTAIWILNGSVLLPAWLMQSGILTLERLWFQRWTPFAKPNATSPAVAQSFPLFFNRSFWVHLTSLKRNYVILFCNNYFAHFHRCFSEKPAKLPKLPSLRQARVHIHYTCIIIIKLQLYYTKQNNFGAWVILTVAITYIQENIY